jgi:hypothetical protein
MRNKSCIFGLQALSQRHLPCSLLLVLLAYCSLACSLCEQHMLSIAGLPFGQFARILRNLHLLDEHLLPLYLLLVQPAHLALALGLLLQQVLNSPGAHHLSC